MADLRALTLRCPWAWAVTHCGKRIENRTWRPPRHLIGRRIAIHAGKAPNWNNDEAREEVVEAIDWMDDLKLLSGPVVPRVLLDLSGAIVALATLGEPVVESSSPWFVGPIGWQLDDVLVLPKPVLCRGMQGLWTVPAAEAALVLAQEVARG